MNNKPNPWPQVVKLDDIIKRFNALAGIRQAEDETLILLCKRCQKPYKFCGCKIGVVTK